MPQINQTFVVDYISMCSVLTTISLIFYFFGCRKKTKQVKNIIVRLSVIISDIL